jgi:NOL1/NOP2/sun family putative RNA methylase
MARRPRGGGRRGRGQKPARDRAVDLDRYRPIIEDWEAFSEAAGRPEPTVFRIRAGQVSEVVLLERLAEQGFVTRPLAGLPSFHQVEHAPRAISQTLEHWLGLIYIQQASTGVAAPSVGVSPGQRVLDMCSAPGGKTTHLAELMGDRGCLVAGEISEPRIRGLLGNVYRLGHPNILVVAGDGREFPEGALFDHVLLDAPCSGEGTLRRSGGQAPNQSSSFLGYVTAAQRSLLEKAVRLTRPGGTILYVTCTFSPEENEAVVSEALGRLPIELEPLELPVPHARGVTSWDGKNFDPRVEGAARIYPHHLDSGGLFLARLRRLDDGDEGPSSGWGSVPTRFGDEETLAPNIDGPESDAVSLEERDVELLDSGIADLAARYGVPAAPDVRRWILRGGRAWMHTLDEWPLNVWEPGPWRPISVGFRAIDFDSQGRPRPTNDLLRWLGTAVTDRVIDLDAASLKSVLERQPIPTHIEARGPVALSWRGDVVGRGAVTGDGLKSEIPKARAADLLRLL